MDTDLAMPLSMRAGARRATLTAVALLTVVLLAGTPSPGAQAQVVVRDLAPLFTYRIDGGRLRTQGGSGGTTYAGPVLTKDGVAWGEARQNRLRIVRAWVEVRGQRSVHEVVGPTRDEVRGRLTAGNGFLALGYATRGPDAGSLVNYGQDGGLAIVLDGGGRTRLATGCGGACSPSVAASDGENVAYMRKEGIAIRNVRTGGETQLPIFTSGGNLAGPYLSYIDELAAGKALVVYDWVARREVYRLPGTGLGLRAGEGPESSALQADGTDGGRVAWSIAAVAGSGWSPLRPRRWEPQDGPPTVRAA